MAPGGHVNVYLVQGDKGALLVDTGWNSPQTFAALQEQLHDIGLGFEDITQIVVTHTHFDHYGLVSRLKQLCSAQLIMHKMERTLLESWYMNADYFMHDVEYWLSSNGMPEEELGKSQMYQRAPEVRSIIPVLPEVTFSGGEEIAISSFHFEVIWTPGHTAGHICLYEPEKKILLSGDHILPITTPNISFNPCLPGMSANPLDEYLDSLAEIQGLDVDLILPGHEHVFRNLRGRIEEMFQHHRERKEAILDTIRDEPRVAYQISSEIPWVPEEGGVPWDKLSPFDRRMALMETLSHLESLRVEGRVEKIPKDKVILYAII
jgi:glyoxylase-like metal-dependent hydrolase (beta-lactamase superfamily II)